MIFGFSGIFEGNLIDSRQNAIFNADHSLIDRHQVGHFLNLLCFESILPMQHHSLFPINVDDEQKAFLKISL